MSDYNLEFGSFREVETKNGPMKVKSAAPTKEFWSEWRSDKESLKEAGYGVSKYQEEWQVSFWQEITPLNIEDYAVEDDMYGDLFMDSE